MDFRQAQNNDIELLTQWTFNIHQHEDDGELKAHPDFFTRLKTWLICELENPANLYLIALQNKQPIGFIAASQVINDNGFLENPTKGIIQLLWVEPEYRKQGVAQKLVQEIERCFQHQGVTYVECTFTARNQHAREFWQKQKYNSFSISARKLLS